MICGSPQHDDLKKEATSQQQPLTYKNYLRCLRVLRTKVIFDNLAQRTQRSRAE